MKEGSGLFGRHPVFRWLNEPELGSQIPDLDSWTPWSLAELLQPQILRKACTASARVVTPSFLNS